MDISGKWKVEKGQGVKSEFLVGMRASACASIGPRRRMAGEARTGAGWPLKLPLDRRAWVVEAAVAGQQRVARRCIQLRIQPPNHQVAHSMASCKTRA